MFFGLLTFCFIFYFRNAEDKLSDKDHSPPSYVNQRPWDEGGEKDGFPERSPQRERRDDRREYERDSSRTANSGNTLYCGDLPYNMTVEQLKAKFEQYGEIEFCSIPTEPYSKQGRGFGFIRFVDAKSADDAVANFRDTSGMRIEKVLKATTNIIFSITNSIINFF